MPLKVLKPITPGTRGATWPSYEEITRDKPEESLLVPLRKSAGRNNRGKITARHRGGGNKQKIRIIDFKRDKIGIPGRVVSIEYDPGRSARIAQVQYADGEKRYILFPLGLEVDAKIESGPRAEIRPGNALPLKSIPTGTLIHNLEIAPGKGGGLVRSAGVAAQVLSREDNYVLVRLPSGEVREFLGECQATVGQVGNVDHKNVILGKAGKRRHLGWRPHVRGGAMSPRDHPHGGGAARAPIGLPGPKSPWGKPTRGFKTRSKRKPSSAFILKRRK